MSTTATIEGEWKDRVAENDKGILVRRRGLEIEYPSSTAAHEAIQCMVDNAHETVLRLRLLAERVGLDPRRQDGLKNIMKALEELELT